MEIMEFAERLNNIDQGMAELRDKQLETTNNMITLVSENSRLKKELDRARRVADRMTKLAIYYDAIYDLLSPAAKEEVKELGDKVIKEYELGRFEYADYKLQRN